MPRGNPKDRIDLRISDETRAAFERLRLAMMGDLGRAVSLTEAFERLVADAEKRPAKARGKGTPARGA